MSQLYTEADINLALSDITSQKIPSQRRAAAIYNIPQSTFNDRVTGARSRRDREPNRKRMTKLEEEVIVERILNESSRGLATSKDIVRDMANKLLEERGRAPVGKN